MELLLPVGGLLEFLSGINLKYSVDLADPKGTKGERERLPMSFEPNRRQVAVMRNT